MKMGEGIGFNFSKIVGADKEESQEYTAPTRLLHADDDLAVFARSWQELGDTTRMIRAKAREYGPEVKDGKTRDLISQAVRDYPTHIANIKDADASSEYLG